MFESFKKSLADRQEEEIQEHLSKGRSHVEGKMFNQALIDFNKALDIDREIVYPKLIEMLEEFSASGNVEGALSVGLNLLQDDPKNAELANKLGNFAREAKDFKQAAELYKHAIRADKKFPLPIYNLAACHARIPKYDDQAVDAVHNFDKVESYIFPDYLGGPQVVEQANEVILQKKEAEFEVKVQQLEEQILDHTRSGETEEAGKLELEKSSLTANRDQVTADDMHAYFDELIMEDSGNMFTHMYNHGIYCLNASDHEMALELFVEIGKAKLKMRLEYLPLCISLAKAMAGNLDEAIKDIVKMLGSNRYNRYYNANLGLMYRQKGEKLLAYKYLGLSSFLLEKSEGLYSIHDLEVAADDKMEKGRYKDALQLYQVIVSESDNLKAWQNIGDIHMRQNHYVEAIPPFLKMQEIDPSSEIAKAKLDELYQFFMGKGDELFTERKFKPCTTNYEYGLQIRRDIPGIEKAISAYQQLQNKEKVKALRLEIEDIKDAERERQKEAEIQQHIDQGHALLQQKNYMKAAESFEAAYRMKRNQDIFLLLIKIYKGLKKESLIQDLIYRRNQMIEYEEKMKKYEKSRVRKDKAGEEEDGDDTPNDQPTDDTPAE
jgi:tetratricopeptide (TPR) repeat protein